MKRFNITTTIFHVLTATVLGTEGNAAARLLILYPADSSFEESPTKQNNICEVTAMADHHETYKGKEIVIRQRAAGTHRRAEALEAQEMELLIEGKPVFIVQNSAGQYLAAGFAFDPQSSPLELAKKIIDYQVQGGR